MREVSGLERIWLNGSTAGDSRCHAGAHILGARAQEGIMIIAIAAARVSALESLFVQLVLVECRGRDRDPMHVVPQASDGVGRSPVSFPDSRGRCSTQLICKRCSCRFSVLQNCPHHVRGRFTRVRARCVGHAFTRRPQVRQGRGPMLEALLFVAHVVPQTWIRQESDEGRTDSQMCSRQASGQACCTKPTLPFAHSRSLCTGRIVRSAEPQPRVRKCDWEKRPKLDSVRPEQHWLLGMRTR